MTHGVDQDDGERGDGESEDETLRNVPQDDAEAEGEQQHQHHGHPRKGSEEKHKEDCRPGQDDALDGTEQSQQQQAARQGTPKADVCVLVILRKKKVSV